MNYQKLFDHMFQEHGLTLTEGEMQDIIHEVNSMQSKGKTKKELKDKFLKMFDDFHETYSKDEIFEWFWNNLRESHANKDGWVRVEDGLPPFGQEVAVLRTDGRVTALTRLTSERAPYFYRWENDYPSGNLHLPEAITHWQPLPPKPQI